jgi:hypothetical protein
LRSETDVHGNPSGRLTLMSLRTSCIPLVRVSADKLASLSRLLIAQRYNGILSFQFNCRMPEKSKRLATRLWDGVTWDGAQELCCVVTNPRCPFRSRWYRMIPPCCVVTRLHVRHSIPALHPTLSNKVQLGRYGRITLTVVLEMRVYVLMPITPAPRVAHVGN